MKLSVLMIAYNQEKYIGQALESALSQRVTFPYEIVLGEDGSADRTRAIASEYAARYPGVVRLLPPEGNLGMHRNFVRTFRACRAEYVALLEGDDYWSSPLKLQRQVDYLDTHADCALCMHPVDVFDEGARKKTHVFPSATPPILTFEDLLLQNHIATCSVVFRRALVGELPEWVFGLRMLDWPLFLLIARHGNIGLIKKVMGVYRLHPGGVWSGHPPVWKMREGIKLYECLSAHFGPRYDPIIRTQIELLNRAIAGRGWRWRTSALLQKSPYLHNRVLPLVVHWRRQVLAFLKQMMPVP